MRMKFTTPDFINKSNNRHNFLYDYSKSIYANNRSKITIICKQHGEFTQQSSHHLRGNGCPHCARELNGDRKRANILDIIQKFKNIHGELYNYSNVQYKGLRYKVEIICTQHGSFFQQPHDHIHGSGCPICAINRISGNTENFINKAKQIHGDIYDYSNVQYINSHTKVEVICKEHGSFNVLPTNHVIRKSRCPKCAAVVRGVNVTIPKDEIFMLANKVHNNKYDYSLAHSEYTNTSAKIHIICPIHGIFQQKVTNHVYSKQGCPSCGNLGRYSTEFFEKLENRDIPGILYVLHFRQDDESFWKIGITKRSVSDRWKDNKGFVITEEYLLHTTIYEAYLIEQHMLNYYLYRMRYIPSVKIGGDNECFNFTNQRSLNWLIQEIETYRNVLA